MKVVEQSFSCTACNAAHCGGWKRSDCVSNCAVLILVIQLECLIRGDLFLRFHKILFILLFMVALPSKDCL